MASRTAAKEITGKVGVLLTTALMQTYAQFIDEIRPLRSQIDDLRHEAGLSNSAAFKKWNHALLMLVSGVKSRGYRNTGCYIEGRIFTHHNPWSNTDAATYFNAELDDTMIELDNIISNFEKYGDPKPPTPVAPPVKELPAALEAAPAPPTFATLPKPGELTWSWVSTSVPFAYWYLAAGAAVALAGIGFQAGDMWAGRRAAAAAEALQRPAAAAVAPGQAKPSATRK